jgi:hypothetical protein
VFSLLAMLFFWVYLFLHLAYCLLSLYLFCSYTVEFQERSLLFAHMLIWLDCHRGQADRHRDDLPRDASAQFIDGIVLAELPDVAVDPLAYVLVDNFIVHGPCGRMDRTCPCMRDGVCSKRSKTFSEETSVGLWLPGYTYWIVLQYIHCLR